MENKVIIKNAINRLINIGIITSPKHALGCSKQEIKQLENALDIILPRAYRCFLEEIGKSADKFLCGSDFSITELVDIQQEAKYLLNEYDNTNILHKKHFIFLMHQGYQFLFFDTSSKEADPKIYLYIEGEEPIEVAETFTAWLTQCVEDEIKAFKALQ